MSLSDAPPPRAITVTGLTVRRGERTLFKGLDFVVPQGAVLAVRGANGAGKTTLLLVLAGIIRADAGRIDFAGRDPATVRPGADIHLFGHLPALKPRLTVAENLRFWALVSGATGMSVGAALGEVGLGAIAALDAGYLSAGQSRRLALARLLVSLRPIWLLDEPTAALDAAGEALVGRLIDRHRDGGGIVIAATHHDLMLGKAPESLTLGGPA